MLAGSNVPLAKADSRLRCGEGLRGIGVLWGRGGGGGGGGWLHACG